MVLEVETDVEGRWELANPVAQRDQLDVADTHRRTLMIPPFGSGPAREQAVGSVCEDGLR